MKLSSVVMLLSPISVCSDMGGPPDIPTYPSPKPKLNFAKWEVSVTVGLREG